MLLGGHRSPYSTRRPPYARLRAGDTVRFTTPPLGPPGPSAGSGARDPPRRNRGSRVVEVRARGAQPDRGPGSAGGGPGVPGAGPADPEATGWPTSWWATPTTPPPSRSPRGDPPPLQADGLLTVVGGPRRRRPPGGRPPGRPGASFRSAPARRSPSVGRDRIPGRLAVAGGFDPERWFGSRPADVLSGLGPPSLGGGAPSRPWCPPRPQGRPASRRRPAGRPRHSESCPAPTARRRPLRGLARDLAGRRGVEPDRPPSGASRTGGSRGRLGRRRHDGRADHPVDRHGHRRRAGPPGGEPIILLPDHATVGGIRWRARIPGSTCPGSANSGPATRSASSTVDPATAGEAWDRREASLDDRVSGWFPTVAGT